MKINSRGWLKVSLHRLQCIFVALWKYSNKRYTRAAAFIRGRRLFTFPLHVRRLIEGGAYSGAALNRGKRLFEQIRYPQNNEMQLSTSMGNKQSCTYAHIAQQQ